MLSQVVYYLPSVLAHVVALGVAAAFFSRARLPAGLLAGGTGLQLVASALSFGTSVWIQHVAMSGDYPASTYGTVGAVLGVAASLLRAFGEVMVAGAVATAILRSATPAAATVDPYGFPKA
jgi:hypothetical protein